LDSKRIAASPQAEEAWLEHAHEPANRTLLSSFLSWFVGTSIPGKKPVLVFYANSAANYRKGCADAAAKNYEGFVLA
jgi:cyclohexanone monooxygenase